MGAQEILLLRVVVVAFSAVSGLFSLWALRRLFTRFSSARSAIFWRQMVALVFTDFIAFVYRGLLELFVIMQLNDSLIGTLSLFGSWLELCCCVIEVHISLGFAVAVFNSPKVTELFRHTLPICFLLAAIPSLIGGCYERNGELQDSMFVFSKRCDSVWGISVFVCCALAISSYIGAAVFATLDADRLTIVHAELRQAHLMVQRGALLRGGTYLLCFLFTCAPQAANSVLFYDSKNRFWTFFGTTFYLNGAVNVISFMYWNSMSDCSLTVRELGQSGAARSVLQLMQHFDLRHARKHREIPGGDFSPRLASTASQGEESPSESSDATVQLSFGSY